jgi:hypothetical protein
LRKPYLDTRPARGAGGDDQLAPGRLDTMTLRGEADVTLREPVGELRDREAAAVVLATSTSSPSPGRRRTVSAVACACWTTFASSSRVAENTSCSLG